MTTTTAKLCEPGSVRLALRVDVGVRNGHVRCEYPIRVIVASPDEALVRVLCSLSPEWPAGCCLGRGA